MLGVRWEATQPVADGAVSIAEADGRTILSRDFGNGGEFALSSGLLEKDKVYALTVVAMPEGGSTDRKSVV